MHRYDVIVIGGGPAGFAAAMSARNIYPGKTIALIRKESAALIPCGIPYTMHRLDSVEDNILPDAPLEKAHVTIIVDRVVGRDGKTLRMASDKDIAFDRLVVATGSRSIIPSIPGSEKAGVFTVKKEIDALHEFKNAVTDSSSVVIVGGGCVGVEFADEILKVGKQVAIVDQLPHLLPFSLDVEFSGFIEAAIQDQGGKLEPGTSIARIEGRDRVETVLLNDGRRLPCDLVIVAVGFKPLTWCTARPGSQLQLGDRRR